MIEGKTNTQMDRKLTGGRFPRKMYELKTEEDVMYPNKKTPKKTQNTAQYPTC